MYKRITLEKFERKESCKLADYQCETIEGEIERIIKILNNAIEDGREPTGYFMTTYENQLSGLQSACSMIGIITKVNYERIDEIETKGDEVGTNVIN